MIPEAASEQRNWAPYAISSAVAKRPAGVRRMVSAMRASLFGIAFQASVSTAPAVRYVDADATRREFDGEMARKRLKRALGRAYQRIARESTQGSPGTDRHDA